METRIMVHFNINRRNTYCWTIFIVSITEVYNQNTTVYGYEGDTVILSCPLTPPAVSGRTTWKGPPSSTVYFYNTVKDPNAYRGERLSVILNTVSGVYNLRITNLTTGVDDGMFSCVVNTNPIQEYFINLKLHSQQYFNLTGSSDYAFLGKAFTLTCRMLKPLEISINYVLIKRNSILCVGIGYVSGRCLINSDNPRYTYGCLSENAYTLTIPADNMTVYEQNSQWHCESIANSSYRSPSIILNIAVDVHNISISPNDNPLTFRESSQMKVRCLVNSNAVPAPNITWYLGSTDITSRAGTNTTFISLTGHRTDNTKTLQCRATNNNKPPKTASTVLNIEYPPFVTLLSQQNILEGRNLSVTCTVTPGNPSSATFHWTKADNPAFGQNGPTLQFHNIQRTSSGTYRCIAENNYSNGGKGTDSQTMDVNVQYPSTVKALSNQNIIEGGDLSVNCSATPGNPNSTTFYWTKEDDTGFRQDGATLQIHNIQRTSSGTYRCTAENKNSNLEQGTHSQSMDVNVQYQPVVNALSNENIIEGKDLSVNCTATPGNPNSTTFYWTKEDDTGFRQDGATLQLPNIQRTSSGTYRCTAENNYSNGEKGTHSQSMVVNVLFQPTIESKPLKLVNDSEEVILTRNIYSNPLSNVSWYNATELLKTQTSVTTASFTIARATCTDTMNYTLVATNGVGNMVSTIVELIDCKPMSDKTNVTLGVTCTTGIEFSSIIIAYPEPVYEIQYENGTTTTQMMNYITRNALNNFTVRFRQTVIDQSSFGLYYLRMSNIFGESTVIVHVIEQRRPDYPRKLEVMCEETKARVQWISSFNGGDPQYFTVIILNSQDGTILSYRLLDKGENKIHFTYITNLQPSVTYWFSVSAKNSHGSSSSNVSSCKTIHVKETASSQIGVVAGTVVGALMLVTIVIIIVICAHRRYTCIIGFEKRNRDIKEDRKKDASNYTTIKEQQDHTQRDMYDELTPNEKTNQYEAIMQKDNRGNNEKLYEQLQESVAKEGNSDNHNIPLKTKDSSDDKFVAQYAEEYMNTSFMK